MNTTAKHLYDCLLALRAKKKGDKSFVAHASETLGKLIGKCVRVVQLALRRLIAAGYIRREVDYDLKKSRRRFYFADSEPHLPGFETGPETSPFGARNCARSAQEIAPTPALPPDPPIEESGDDGIKGIGDDGPPASSSSVLVSPSTQTPGPETGDAEVIAQAEAVFGSQPTVAAKVRSAARRYTWGLVRAAIDVAARQAARKPIVWGYVENTLRNMREEGATGEEVAAALAQPHFMTSTGEGFDDIFDLMESRASEVAPW